MLCIEPKINKKFVKKNKTVEHKKPEVSYRGKKQISGRQRRKLGFYKIKEKKVCYKSFLKFHDAWKETTSYVLGLEHLRLHKYNGDPRDSLTETVQNRFKKIELFGSIAEVTSSRNPNLVGLKGLVINESKCTFTIVSEDDKVKSVPKMDSVFNFVLDEFSFSVFGSHIYQRPVDKAKHALKKQLLWPCGSPY